MHSVTNRKPEALLLGAGNGMKHKEEQLQHDSKCRGIKCTMTL